MLVPFPCGGEGENFQEMGRDSPSLICQHPPWQSSPGEHRVPHIHQRNVLGCGQALVLPKINASPWERASIFLPLNQERVQLSHAQGQIQSPLGRTKSFQRYISSFSALFLDNSSRWKLL